MGQGVFSRKTPENRLQLKAYVACTSWQNSRALQCDKLRFTYSTRGIFTAIFFVEDPNFYLFIIVLSECGNPSVYFVQLCRLRDSDTLHCHIEFNGHCCRLPSVPSKPKKRKTLGRDKLVGRPRLFGGTIEEYVEVSGPR
jgi:hypothetical protein